MLKTQKTTFSLKISIGNIIQQSNISKCSFVWLMMYFLRLRLFNLKDYRWLCFALFTSKCQPEPAPYYFCVAINTKSLQLKLFSHQPPDSEQQLNKQFLPPFRVSSMVQQNMKDATQITAYQRFRLSSHRSSATGNFKPWRNHFAAAIEQLRR